jgi:glutathione S-transferase
MSDPILHHYASSPFSEKVRAMLGFKTMAWRSVDIPIAPPRPDTVALTGGYRRTPVLQIGCDVYCDTRLIARVLDSLQPEPALCPEGHEVGVRMLAQWADQMLFPAVTPHAFKPEALERMAQNIPQEAAGSFLQDRMALSKTARVRPLGRMAFDHLPAYLQLLQAQLSVRQYLVTDAPTEADFAVYHCLWFLNRGLPEVLEPHPAVVAFLERIEALGHGSPSPLDSGEALSMCRDAEPQALGESLPESGNGVTVGSRVEVSPADYALDPTVGELVHLSVDEVVVAREDPRAGRVHVHFPRVGFQLKPHAD